MDSFIRRVTFWCLDIIKGSKVLKNVKEIKKIINVGKSNQKQLNNILTYACNNSDYYKKINSTNLKDFPVMDKKKLVEAYDKILIGDINEKKLHWTCTSGSTGTPLKIPQDREKRNRTKADLIFFNKKADWQLGDKYVFIRSWTSQYKMSKLRIFAQNFIMIDTNTFNDKSKEELRKLLKKDKKIKCILGYSSALTSFVEYLQRKKDNASMFHINVIVTASDELTQSAKKQLKKMFNCKIINRISNEEHGLLAMNFDNTDYFTLNTASYYFEILKLDSDIPAEFGELGRLVVTDLYNKKFPLIRYDIGDLAIGISKDNKGSINKLSSFEGRSGDVLYNSDGAPITCVSLSTHLCTIPGISHYQLQIKNNVKTLCIVPSDEKIDNNLLRQKLNEIFGKKEKINVEMVKNILLEKNGKYRTIKFIK